MSIIPLMPGLGLLKEVNFMWISAARWGRQVMEYIEVTSNGA